MVVRGSNVKYRCWLTGERTRNVSPSPTSGRVVAALRFTQPVFGVAQIESVGRLAGGDADTVGASLAKAFRERAGRVAARIGVSEMFTYLPVPSLDISFRCLIA
jgi:hypothetical protein